VRKKAPEKKRVLLILQVKNKKTLFRGRGGGAPRGFPRGGEGEGERGSSLHEKGVFNLTLDDHPSSTYHFAGRKKKKRARNGPSPSEGKKGRERAKTERKEELPVLQR